MEQSTSIHHGSSCTIKSDFMQYVSEWGLPKTKRTGNQITVHRRCVNSYNLAIIMVLSCIEIQNKDEHVQIAHTTVLVSITSLPWGHFIWNTKISHAILRIVAWLHIQSFRKPFSPFSLTETILVSTDASILLGDWSWVITAILEWPIFAGG